MSSDSWKSCDTHRLPHHDLTEWHVLRAGGPFIFTVRGARASWCVEWREPGNFRLIFQVRDEVGEVRRWGDVEMAKLYVEGILRQLGVSF